MANQTDNQFIQKYRFTQDIQMYGLKNIRDTLLCLSSPLRISYEGHRRKGTADSPEDTEIQNRRRITNNQEAITS